MNRQISQNLEKSVAVYPWLAPLFAQICHGFELNKGHHAILLRLDKNIGAENLSRALIEFLLPNITSDFQHPDLFITNLDNDDSVGVDEIRNINQQLEKSTTLGGNRVIWIKDLTKLTENALNALLKSLEEPPKNSFFILNLEKNSHVLPTILSRCQQWFLDKIDPNIAYNWLKQQLSQQQNISLNDTQINAVLSTNQFNPLLSLDIILNNQQQNKLAFLRAFWLTYKNNNPFILLKILDSEIFFTQLDWLESFINDAIYSKFKLDLKNVAPLDKGIIIFSQENSLDGLFAVNKIIGEFRFKLKTNKNLNLELLGCDLLIQILYKLNATK